jgi:predicted outer membrane repeat protein
VQFTLSGENAVITNNQAERYGGGVYVEGGTFIMERGEISLNQSAQQGGGVLSLATFIMQGGKIWGNTTVDCGSGVLAWNPNNFIMEGGVIYGSDETTSALRNTPDTVHNLTGSASVWPQGTTGYVGATSYPSGGDIPSTGLTVRAETP